MTNSTDTQQDRHKYLFSWIRLALLFCLMLYFLMRAIDYLHQAGCAQSPAVGTTIQSGDLGFISAGYQWLVMLLGAAIFATWPGVSKRRGMWRAFFFLIISFCLSIVLSVWYETDVAETCVRPGAAMLDSDAAGLIMSKLASAPPTRI